MKHKWEWDSTDLDKRRKRVYGPKIDGFIFIHPTNGGKDYTPLDGEYVRILSITRIVPKRPDNFANNASFFCTLHVTEGNCTTMLYLLETRSEVRAKILDIHVDGEMTKENEND